MTTGGAVQIDWLGTFLAVADHSGVRAAAHVLHLSQSRVSAHLAALERAVGVRLVDRGPRGTKLTAQGEAYRAHVRLAVAELDRGVLVARETNTRPVARIGVCAPVPDLIGGLVWPALASCPRPCFIPLPAYQAAAALRAGTIDAAVVPEALLGPHADRTYLWTEDVVAVGPLRAAQTFVLAQDLPGLRAGEIELGPGPQPMLDIALGVALARAGHGAVVGMRGAISAAFGPDVQVRSIGTLAFALAWCEPAAAWLAALESLARKTSVPKTGTGDATFAHSPIHFRV